MKTKNSGAQSSRFLWLDEKDSLRKQLHETTQDLQRTRAELDRLAMTELEIRHAGNERERDKINAMAEVAIARIRELEGWARKLEDQLATTERETLAPRRGARQQ